MTTIRICNRCGEYITEELNPPFLCNSCCFELFDNESFDPCEYEDGEEFEEEE